ncbi:MAG: radical SAM protein [Candidatus Omnitrophica bacterium]|nr:radical SAM protein [Candidatus Omnitrophota bacterium]
MKHIDFGDFHKTVANKWDHKPLHGHIELTYRCDLDCIHCYCKGNEDKSQELSLNEWKEIFDEIQREGCVWLTMSGGEPSLRDDFLELYSYAKDKGFIITLFTNAHAVSDTVIEYLIKSPPMLIEVTLNGITKDTYETVTQVEGSFERCMTAINKMIHGGLYLMIKSNYLSVNKDEIPKIKEWTEQNIGKLSKNAYRFKYDPIISPRLNGDTSSCRYRLSFDELMEARKDDPDIWKEYKKCLHSGYEDLQRDRRYLYQCNSWMRQFFVNPYGRLKFCILTDKFSVDLRTTPFKEGFYHTFPQLLKEEFKTNSKCQFCDLKALCFTCPAKALLETGDEEAPVEYYCRLAEENKRYREALHCSKQR